jgi:hypothetical protein
MVTTMKNPVEPFTYAYINGFVFLYSHDGQQQIIQRSQNEGFLNKAAILDSTQISALIQKEYWDYLEDVPF